VGHAHCLPIGFLSFSAIVLSAFDVARLGAQRSREPVMSVSSNRRPSFPAESGGGVAAEAS